jgi:MFS family permease
MCDVCFFDCESFYLSFWSGLIALQAAFTEQGAAQTFHVSHEVTILGISIFVTGLGTGPLLVGPLSEVYGTSKILIQKLTFKESSRPKCCIRNILCVIFHLHIPRGVCSQHR